MYESVFDRKVHKKCIKKFDKLTFYLLTYLLPHSWFQVSKIDVDKNVIYLGGKNFWFVFSKFGVLWCIFKYALKVIFVHLFKSFTEFILSSPRKVQAPTGQPSADRAFNELRRYYTRPSPFNWGPKNVHFGKTHFRDLNINARIFKNNYKHWDQ